jgi:hypothetical protein
MASNPSSILDSLEVEAVFQAGHTMVRSDCSDSYNQSIIGYIDVLSQMACSSICRFGIGLVSINDFHFQETVFSSSTSR